MTELIIDDALAAQLHQIAALENRPVSAVLRSMLDTYMSPVPTASNWPLAMATLAEQDTDIPWNDQAATLSEQRCFGQPTATI